jgi:hypothetical protein
MASSEAIHTGLAAGRWYQLSLSEQLGNVGSEVSRALRAKRQGNESRTWSAVDRACELIDLTIADPANAGRRRELCRAREVMCDFLVGTNAYASTPENLDRYFTAFALAARRRR